MHPSQKRQIEMDNLVEFVADGMEILWNRRKFGCSSGFMLDCGSRSVFHRGAICIHRTTTPFHHQSCGENENHRSTPYRENSLSVLDTAADGSPFPVARSGQTDTGRSATAKSTSNGYRRIHCLVETIYDRHWHGMVVGSEGCTHSSLEICRFVTLIFDTMQSSFFAVFI